MTPTPIRVGLLGYGLAGRVFHAPLINACEGLDLAAIVTTRPERQQDAISRYPEAEVIADASLLWARASEFDVVVVATPNRSHVPLGLEAVAHDLAVVVDKPIATDTVGARQLVSAAQRAGVMCTVFQNRRYDSDFLTLRSLIDNGALGNVLRLESRFERWQPIVGQGWREHGDTAEGDGVLFDLGSHLIDQAIVLFGAPESVYAEIETRRPESQVDDNTFVSIVHRSGIRSHLFMSKVAARPGLRFHLLGDVASWTKTGLDTQETDLARGRHPTEQGFGREPIDQWGVLGTDTSSTTTEGIPGAYLLFYDQLVTAMHSDAPPPVDPVDAITVIEVVEAAIRSGDSGSSVSFKAV